MCMCLCVRARACSTGSAGALLHETEHFSGGNPLVDCSCGKGMGFGQLLADPVRSAGTRLSHRHTARAGGTASGAGLPQASGGVDHAPPR